MQISMQLDAEFEWISRNIDAVGSSDAVILQIYVIQISMHTVHILSKYCGIPVQGVWVMLLSGEHKWCKYWCRLLQILSDYCGTWIQGVRWCCYWENIHDVNINVDWFSYQVSIDWNIDEYQCRHRVNIDENIDADIGWENKQIYVEESTYSFGTNNHSNQNMSSKIC